MAKIEDHSNYVIKTEDFGFPEAEKYIALNAMDAPVVKLLDVIEEDNTRKIVLEKARPLAFDSSQEVGFNKVLDWVVEFNSIHIDGYPECNLKYIESYWKITSQLFTEASNSDSSLYRESFDSLPSAEYILSEFKSLVFNGVTNVSHGDPADSNLGIINGELVAFDLGLSWMNSPLVDLALRTGAQVTPFPANVSINELVESYAQSLNIDSSDPVRDYSICGAIYGSYFEESALNAILTGSAATQIVNWANLTLDRFQAYASKVPQA